MNTHHAHFRRHMIGLGLDGDDGHKRLTRGEGFHLIGGSAETHEGMIEKSVKLQEQLKKRGKTIANASREEFYDTARTVGLPVVPKQNPNDN